MKKLVFGLIATVMFGFVGSAQSLDGKIASGNETIDIPIEVRSLMKFDLKSQEFTQYVKYSEKLKGEVVLILDSKNKVVRATLPVGFAKAALGPIGKCLKDCMGGGSSESGAWLCYWVCITGI
jgi:hypothetical protein